MAEASTPGNGLILESREGPVAAIRLNRPEKRNALNVPMVEALRAAVERAGADAAVRVIVLRGAGPVFCAGLDLQEAQDPEVNHRSAEALARMFEALAASPKVTIAAVHGAAIAGGAGVMSACDLVLAAADAKFGYPEVRRGLVAGLVMTFLRRQVRDRDARELLLTGEIIDAERAREIGLITRVVPTDLLDDAVELLAAQILKGGPEALAHTKRFLARLEHRSVREELEAALALHVEVRGGAEAQEGMRAFVEKRPPAWDA